ncbi:MAG: hypothetical protein LC114_15990 [Bryobacterales bacterium]|nr:hypothetical protein [Bryobacterales bacterium]
MPFFPQLSNGSIAQFPLTRSRRFRTILNETVQDVPVSSPDTAGQRTVWSLSFQGLTDLERKSVEDLASASSGMLRTFTFLDPYDNLLPQSEHYLASVWHKDAGLVVTPGQTDPYGTHRASLLSNPTNLSLRLYQVLAIPCSFRFVASIYARANAPATTSLLIGADSELNSRDFATLPEWTRHEIHNNPSDSQDLLLIGIHLPENTEIVIFGSQLEATLVPTDYKVTSDHSGVHEGCRLASDRLQWTTSGIDNHSITLSVVTTHP